ncbi:MAG: putative nucleotidyltransferase substrate binding domain-containing protein [Rhodospirillales bacterium]
MASKSRKPAGRSRTAVFSMTVRDSMRPRSEVLAVRAGTRCADTIALLAADKASCVIVVDAAGRPAGIITEQDIARRITYRVPGETSVEQVMTSPVATIARRDYLYHAISRMRRHRLRHMPVVDKDGRLAGILYLHDALAVAADRLMGQIDRLSHEGTLDGLKEVKAAQVELAEELFADNLPAPEIQQLLTRINNDMYRRIGELVLAQMAEEGWGDPPVSAATIVMGSGGRGENYLFPDQDNGFIVTDYPDNEHGRVDPFFIELAERMCRHLNTVGIPYCNGYCMAVNPLWRKTLSQWVEQITLWGKKSNFVAIRLADIFFDFQPVWGDLELAVVLRRQVTDMVRHNHFFLKQMFQDQADHNVALGFFGGFITEKEKQEYKGQVNLKYTGTIPLVEAIRLLALREGVEETSTLERIRELHEKGVLGNTENDDLSSAFYLITDIILRKQVKDYRAGRRVGYFVDPELLAKRDRVMLLESLKAINNVRKRVRLEFTADVF